ncbi:hypothetical protein WS86_27565 [Burkholderia savannae]|uniref:hypothetical protein n=1 Tax=Burkholderia savannae TaxID=1637837 RepID=UPI0007544373|nr:hypothetical protein [Burkholderia savannae]AOJ84313.1 hypothetical protein WS86_27565 [Burkholderia savannae]
MFRASSIGFVRARSSRAAWHALAGWAACVLPVAVSHAPLFSPWNAVAAIAFAGVGAMRACPDARADVSHDAMPDVPGDVLPDVSPDVSPIAGAIALSGALLADFASTYPEAVLALCSGASFVEGWALHVRLFPFTTAAMLGLSILCGARGERKRRVRLPRRIVDVVVALGTMMFAMNLSAMLLKTWADLAGWPWGAHGLVCSMLVGMMFHHAATRAMVDAMKTTRASHAIN